MSFNKYIWSCTHYHKHSIEYFLSTNTCTPCNPSSSLSPSPGNHSSIFFLFNPNRNPNFFWHYRFFSVTIDLFAWWEFCVNKIMHFLFFCIWFVSFIIMHLRFINVSRFYSFLLLNRVLHCVVTSQFVFPFTSWKFRLFPVFFLAILNNS